MYLQIVINTVERQPEIEALSVDTFKCLALALIFARPKHRNWRGNPTETLATQAIRAGMIAVSFRDQDQGLISFRVSKRFLGHQSLSWYLLGYLFKIIKYNNDSHYSF